MGILSYSRQGMQDLSEVMDPTTPKMNGEFSMSDSQMAMIPPTELNTQINSNTKITAS